MLEDKRVIDPDYAPIFFFILLTVMLFIFFIRNCLNIAFYYQHQSLYKFRWVLISKKVSPIIKHFMHAVFDTLHILVYL